MRDFNVLIRFAGEADQAVKVSAWGENDAVQKVSRQGLGGVIFAVNAIPFI
jgi:hypothetical protein